ncbi:GTP binding protein [Operophtera brumata]|uniref:GTP binding protein n=1 Tax=Operophtera brumata TaxID=104452 RepID=A0A0L7KYS6_OPEBR|nr:GTP binding protein [Operophtera brumata]
MQLTSDPRRADRERRFKPPPPTSAPAEDLTTDYMNILGMVFSMCGLMMRLKWCAWMAVFCSSISFANSRVSDDTKQIVSSFMLSISAVVMMPPKKVEEPEKKPLIGRVGTNLKVGIVGVPNVGNGIKLINKQSNVEESKRPRLLAAAILGLDNTAAPLPENTKFYDPWTDIDAQEISLSYKPTCYLILSKPGAGAYSLGEAIAKKLSCVHLCPKNIVTDEIDQSSPTGICMNFNMKHNNVCAYDNILKMLKVKLDSPAVKHRGYVLSGFPLVTVSKSSKYLINSLNSEESVLSMQDLMFDVVCNLKKKTKKPKQETGSPHSSITSEIDIPGEEQVEQEEEEQEPEELPEEEQEVKCELPKFLLNTCSEIVFHRNAYYNTKKAVLLQQLNTLFNLEMKPDIIIYVTCPDKDLVTKRTHKYINYKNNMNTIEPFIAQVLTDVRWPVIYKSIDYSSPFDGRTFNPKYSCRQPVNFEENSVQQLCNYKLDILPYVENMLKDYEPNCIIKLDARQTTRQMMHHITERLLLLPIKTVLIPEPLYMEEPPDDLEEFWKSVQELNVLRNGLLSFKRYPSPWFNRCPVELKNRQSTRGNPKLAVSFAKHVYLLSTLDATISFCRNPRPYLKLKYLEPTCRTIVIGTKSSGKTMISECLSWLFDTPIISYEKILESESQKKYNTYSKTILSEIIATLEDARFAAWQEAELNRCSQLDTWCRQTQKRLHNYILLLKKLEKQKVSEEGAEEGLEEGLEIIPEQIPMLSDEFLNKFNTLRNLLADLPFLDDVDLCKDAVVGKGVAKYAPYLIRNPIEKPTIPALGDQDVMAAITAYIIANGLQQEIKPTVEELMNEIVKVLTVIDTDCQIATGFDQMYGKYIIDGFPSDPEYWTFLSESKLMPDYTVALIENREVDADLMEKYKIILSSQKSNSERFMQANDPLIKTNLLLKQQPSTADLDMKIIVNDIIKNTFDFNIPEDIDNANPETDVITSFTEAAEKFKEDWETIKLKVEEHSKCYIDVELENKSDIQVVEEMLLKFRQGFMITCEPNEDEEAGDQDDEEGIPKDIMTYNNPRNLGETNIYCPIAYYDHGVLWEGKPEFGIKYVNKSYNFCNEEASALFQKDVAKYQSYNKPYKNLPPFRICVIGCIGSGKTTLSKLLAKELGLVHINFAEVINELLLPKHFKKVGRCYENSFTDVQIDDEAAAEFQMGEDNENLLSDILSNETELRRIIYNYFESGTPILAPLMEKLITKLWFQDPFVNTGFILDGYPRLPTDIEDMLKCFCIPDLIIEIEGSSEVTLQRLSPKMFKTWKVQLSEAKEKAKQKLDNDRKEWMHLLTKNIVAKLIFDEILENMFFFIVEPVKGLSNDSVIIDAHPSGSSNVDANLFNYYNEMIVEFPEPDDQNEWEKPDEVRERIDSRIESVYETDDENIQSLKDLLYEQRIKHVAIKGTKSIDKVVRLALSKLTNLRNRCESLFEQTFIVTTDIAELVLSEGFCLISKFNRICPVYVYDNPDAIQNVYKLNRCKGKIYPVVHRSYVYFICGPGAVKLFRTNPLKYISNNNIILFKEYPLRICVIGPPKSGKGSLAAKLAKRYGLICISRGIALRYMIQDLHWTELGTKMQADLSSGGCINEDHIIKAIQTVAIDHRTITYGFVLDGFPETASEAMGLCKDGLYPNIVFDIRADAGTILQSSQNEVYYDILKYMPPYSRPYIENRFEKWSDKSYKIRNWINNDYQNIYVLDGNESKWQCLEDAVKVIKEFIPKVHYYLTNVETNIVAADVMCISNDIFEQRMSSFKNMCPLCLHKNVLRHSNFPIDRKGVVQYRNKFFWICGHHMSKVLKHPESYLTAQKVDIPEVPAVVKTVSMDLVHENGICIVNYAENLPSQKIVKGSSNHAASFQGKTYLFCGGKCLAKFLAKPHMYCDITVFKESKLFPQLSLNKLPNLARRVPVPDERYDYLCEFHKPASKVPAFLNVVDIAGLTIGEELRLKDEDQLLKDIDKLERMVLRGNDKKLKPEYKHIRFGDWSAADIEILNKYMLLTSKPALYLVNLSEKDYIRKKNKWLPKLKEWIDKNDPGAPLIPFSGKGTKAPQAAGRIHTDFEKGFIMAEVMHFKDFREEGTEAACKAAGKYRQQGTRDKILLLIVHMLYFNLVLYSLMHVA